MQKVQTKIINRGLFQITPQGFAKAFFEEKNQRGGWMMNFGYFKETWEALKEIPKENIEWWYE